MQQSDDQGPPSFHLPSPDTNFQEQPRSDGIEIINNENGTVEKIAVQELRQYGFEAKTFLSGPKFVCELRIPLESTRKTPCGLVLDGNNVFSLEFAGVEMNIPMKPRSEMPSGFGGPGGDGPGATGGPPSGGGPGGFGGPGGGSGGSGGPPGGGPNGPSFDGPKRLDFWRLIELAVKNNK